ncbi:hypothetical protein [Nonomuraea sp. NPDC049400]|uniref:hypothetical protein n=1 Tax=Nonomuraea sp. NPDC049400 TaxID=3364352 RepID=UPI0037A807A5
MGDGSTHEIDTAELVPGDIVVIEEGDRVAAVGTGAGVIRLTRGEGVVAAADRRCPYSPPNGAGRRFISGRYLQDLRRCPRHP